MRRKRARRYARKHIDKTVFTVLLLLLLVTWPISLSHSVSKYVFNKIIYNVSLYSAEKFPLAAIEAIDGTAQAGRTLTAGALTPAGATAIYQWQRCSTAEGTYEGIDGATGSYYTLSSDDYGCYIRVTASGTGVYAGTVTSAYTAPVTAIQITAISDIIGTTKIGEILTAGSLTPTGATVTYQWQRSDTGNNGIFTNIPGAIESTYTLVGADNYCYIKVIASGTGVYAGTVASNPTTSRVVSNTTPITAIGATTGSAQVGNTLTAGIPTPYDATATYQWQRCAAADGSYTDIPGAVNNAYTLTAADYNYYIKVVVTGSGAYSGTIESAAVGPVTVATITGIGAIGGTTAVGQTLTAGALTPVGATAAYQWQRCDTADGTYTDIPGATANTYTLQNDDYDYYIKVMATGTGSYSGTVISHPTASRVGNSAIPITAIGAINGAAKVGHVLTAGAPSPAGASVTYQWQRSDSADGAYTNIAGATSNTYTLTAADYNKYIKVAATGSGIYSGTAASEYAGPVATAPLTAISDVIGTTKIGQTLTAGTLTPLGANATYQWQRSDTGAGTTYTNIGGATVNTYTIGTVDSYCFLRVVATGTGSYSGTVISYPTASRVSNNATPITAIGPISGTAKVGHVLTVGALTPAGATATYQWQRSDSADGSYTNIAGATANTYTLTAADYNKYIKVAATGSGIYSGTAASAYVGPVAVSFLTAISNIIGTTAIGQTLTAGALAPEGATASYQWLRCDTASGTYTNIAGAIANTYTLQSDDNDYYIKVAATGTGSYSGTVTSAHTGPVSGSTASITGIGAISGTTAAGQTLTAGALSPAGATATYQWQRCDSADGSYANIAGATSNTYTLTAADYNYYIKVVVTGSGTYSGTAASVYAGPVAACPITAISGIIGTTAIGQTLTAGSVTPLGATVTYQWQRSDTGAGTTYTNIGGATANKYTVTGADSYCYLRVIVTGAGAYTGTVTSAHTTSRVGSTTGTITGIGAITGAAQVGNTLTAGTPIPAGATVTYQWQRCDTADGSYAEIPGAITNTYTPGSADLNYYIKVVATGAGTYSGVATSEYTGPVSAATLTAISSIIGTTAIGQTLTAGALAPAGATASYQWQRCSTAEGIYEDIPGAIADTYTLQSGDNDYYIKVAATGTGSYSGTVTSAHTGPVSGSTASITGIGGISGTAAVGQMLTAGALTPDGATVTYQWQRCAAADGDFTDIAGATSNTYTLTAADYNYYIKVAATGSGAYSGTIESAAVGTVEAATLTAIGDISGTPASGQTLTAGSVTPPGATVAYQWQRSDTGDGTTFTDIGGANLNTYTVGGVDSYCYIRVIATGTGAYTGTVTSAATPKRVGQP